MSLSLLTGHGESVLYTADMKVANLILCSIALVGSLMMTPWGSKHVGIFYVI
jgi:hypothetical protein